jgi:prevent-host-death family protein
MENVSISDIKKDISGLINRVAFGRERIVLTSRGRPKAAIIGMADLARLMALDEEERARAVRQELAELAGARALREEILEYTGGKYSNTADLLAELREERDE